MSEIREIKFRAWDKYAKVMVYPGGKGFKDPDYSHQILATYDEVMQFTGLHDKNGIEIFEGDLGFYLETEIKIRWSEFLARWVMDARHSDDPRWYDGKFDINPQIAKDVRITGNIWES